MTKKEDMKLGVGLGGVGGGESEYHQITLHEILKEIIKTLH